MSKLAAARRGPAQIAAVTGPAGIGKTRLAEEVARRARLRGARVAIGRCWRDGEAPPFWPWQGVLRDLGAPDGLLAEHVPATGRERFARFVSVLDSLRSTSAVSPHVVVLDDLHVAGSATLLLTRFLIRERRRLKMLLLLTCRNDVATGSAEREEVWADVLRDGIVLTLTGLSDRAIGAYLSACGVGGVEEELLRGLLVVTSGNPLHLRTVIGHGRIDARTVGTGLDEAIGHMLDRLAASDAHVVAVAALLGMDVSVHEVARLAGIPASTALASLARAAGLGIVRDLPGDRIVFVHERVRDRAVSRVPADERAATYARAARLSTGQDADQTLRRAYYALAASSASTEDAAFAVEAARDAAAVLQAADGFEAAAELLGQAVALHDAAALAGPVAGLLVTCAEAVLRCGRLAEARQLFHRAAYAADVEGDHEALAGAALGLGGVWVREHRLAIDAERVRVLQRRALDALPPDETVLRARLRVRLAAEDAYRGGPASEVREAVDAVRRTGDARALAEALSLYHHVLMVPEHTRRRLGVVRELMAAAVAAGDGLLMLMGLCWRTADLFLMGDPNADASLAELRLRADALRCHSVVFIVRAMEVMLAIRAGRFAEAEQAASACFALGTDVGDADALAYHAGHVAAIRVFQGREDELADVADSIATSPSVIERERIFSFAAALYAARAGRVEQARALLARLRCDGLESIRPTSAWLLTMRIVIDLATLVDDGMIAEAAYEALQPYAELPLMGSLAVVCFGSVHRSLALAALTCGKLDRAVDHYLAALTANERLRHRPAAVQVRAELGLAYLRRGAAGDIVRGQTLLEEAITEAEVLQMTGLIARWRAMAATTPSPEKLSRRLRQTLSCLAEGDSEKRVAARLGVSRTTAHQYVTALYRHFGVRSRGELLAYILKRAGRPDWRPPDDSLSSSA